ncbi:MAG: type II secretion system F family protein [Deltaproteobacteria bacterium]|nr:type II secretion system F family protein [Deltaproteobacteria bacterium]
MNTFKYKLIRPNGEVISKTTTLPYTDEVSALTYLERGHNTPIYAKKLGWVASRLNRLGSTRPQKRINRPFQAEFFSNVSLMLRSGIPLTTALSESASTTGHPAFEKNITDMVYRLQQGESFSSTAATYPQIFPKTVVHLIRLGEETGRLDAMLHEASEHLKRIHRVITDTKQALLYPTLVLACMAGGFFFWFYYVVPKIVSLFQEMNVALPALTVFLLNLSGLVRTHILAILAGILGLAMVMAAIYKTSRRARKVLCIAQLHLPVSRTITQASVMAFLSEHLALLLNAGIDIVRAVTIIQQALRNELYREKLALVARSLAEGSGISEAFGRAQVFPAFVIRMIKVGEESGTLSEQLTHIAEDYRNRLSVVVATLGKIIEPALLIIVGTMFAVIVIGLFLPIYDLVSELSR